jgi:vancomycin resistance protein YoaR
VLLGGAALVAALAAVVFGVVAFLERDNIPYGTTIGGVDVGGMDEAQARAALERTAESRLARAVRLLGPDGAMTTKGMALRAEPLVDEAVADALEVRAVDRVLARIGLRDGPDAELAFRPAPVLAARLGNRIDSRFGDPPRDARVVVSDNAVRVIGSRPGTAVDRRALRRELRTLPREISLSITQAAPVVTTAEAEAAKARIERLLDGPRRVRFRDATSTLTPMRLRALVRTAREDGRLGVSLDSRRLAASLRVRLGHFEVTPRDAAFAVDAQRAKVVRSKPGRALDLERISRSLTSNLESTTHRAWFVVSQPAFTSEEAEKLGITELVSEFTTYYSCCAPRVTNIQRGAELMDGTIVRPGERFSLNEALGKRSVERGFVEAPQIRNGRLEDAVGGGVSQIATTTFNAAFFAGVQLVEHQPHEFYISRYPMGREATVSWGGPELIWRNDWPAAILVKAFADSDSISVRFYSSKLGRRVVTTTGKPREYTSPTTITLSNLSLEPGTTRVVQSSGPSGFLISYTRKVFRGPKLKRSERYLWRYRPENEVIEVGPPRPKPPPPPAKRPPPPPSGDAPPPPPAETTPPEETPPPEEAPPTAETPPTSETSSRAGGLPGSP